MREPVLEDNIADHTEFCKHAANLLERVMGKPLGSTTAAVPSLSRIAKVCSYTFLTVYLLLLTSEDPE